MRCWRGEGPEGRSLTLGRVPAMEAGVPGGPGLSRGVRVARVPAVSDSDPSPPTDLMKAFQLGPSWARDGAPTLKVDKFKDRGEDRKERKGGHQRRERGDRGDRGMGARD